MGMKVNNNYFYVSKVGWVKMAENLRFNGKLMSVTVSQSKSGNYFLPPFSGYRKLPKRTS